jgi:hypothetical protein
MNKILIVTPSHNKINSDTIRCIFELDTPLNSQVDVFFPKNGYPETDDLGRQNIIEKQNQARKIVLSENYTHLFFIEEDMLVPKDALKKLLKVDADVSYGLYCFRRPPFMWNATAALDTEKLVGFSYSSGEQDFINNKFSSVLPVDGLGFGCTLIKKEVLESIEFRIGWDHCHPNGEPSHSDVYFACDCINNGFTQLCDTSVLCGHITSSPKPAVLMPTKIGEGLQNTAYRFLPYGGFESTTPIQKRYEEWLFTPSDIIEHLPILYNYAKGTIVELGTKYGASTSAFVAACENGKCDRAISYDIDPMCSSLYQIPGYKKYWELKEHSSISHDPLAPNKIDVLFIDTIHTYEHVTKELDLWVPKLNHTATILFHDTENPEVKKAIEEHPLLKNMKKEYLTNNNGLGIVNYVRSN